MTRWRTVETEEVEENARPPRGEEEAEEAAQSVTVVQKGVAHGLATIVHCNRKTLE